MADLVIRGGTIVDGTGAPPFVGDVAIKDGRIMGVGPSLAVKGAREVNAIGKHVTPGWIDPHTHYDAQVCPLPGCSLSCPSRSPSHMSYDFARQNTDDVGPAGVPVLRQRRHHGRHRQLRCRPRALPQASPWLRD